MKKKKSEDMEKSRPGTVCTLCDGFGKQYSNSIFILKNSFNFRYILHAGSTVTMLNHRISSIRGSNNNITTLMQLFQLIL